MNSQHSQDGKKLKDPGLKRLHISRLKVLLIYSRTTPLNKNHSYPGSTDEEEEEEKHGSDVAKASRRS